jgi:predicted ATP-grasp superfamily ATP-dependent carboligase
MAMNILVFPCGSEIGLEIHRSLLDKKGITLFGMSSADDHGRYVYENYLPGCPYVTHDEFIDHVKMVIEKYKIDVIYPANEITLLQFKMNEHQLCKVVGPSLETVEICNSKSQTYKALEGVIKVPALFPEGYPVFIKPDIGHSGIGCQKANSGAQVIGKFNPVTDIVVEYLPGREYTIDCFADQYAEGRERKRINNGISVGTTVIKNDRFQTMAKAINSVLNFPGAWFFQVKENIAGELVLMEVGARLAGSSSISRLRGVNVALINLYAEPVRIKQQEYIAEVSRALDVKAMINYVFDNVYVDLDDTLILGGKVNYKLLGLLYKFRNEGKRLYLITRSSYDDAMEKLRDHHIPDLIFTFTIHVKPYERKKDYMRPKSILIDDSFAEREDVEQPAFDIDIVDSLL